MDDLQYGKRNKRGDWAPNEHLQLAPFFSGRFGIGDLLGWVKGFVWPWTSLFMAFTLVWWFFVVPDTQTLQTIGWAWPLRLLLANWVGIFLFYGLFELRYNIQRVQDRSFKYNGKFPSEQPSDVFMFRSQNIDNFLRTFLVSIPIGTAIEVFLLWCYASGAVSTVSVDAHPAYFILLVLLAPIVHEVHFYCIHRGIHWAPLYRWVHSVHHNSVNPSPWSSMSMHPVESTLYFGVAFWTLAVPSHPFIAVWLINLAGFGAIVGHIGFDRLKLGDGKAAQSHAYAHYLHHKHFEVNYSDNGTLPLDKWFGSWHDGSPEGERLMQERFRKKKERVNAQQV